MDRRAILKGLCSGALTLPFAGLFAKTAEAGPTPTVAKRFIVFYFPDGVPAPRPANYNLWSADVHV